MPVDDIEVHEKVRHAKASAGCFNRTGLNPGFWSPDRVYAISGEYIQSQTWNHHTMTKICRQIGRKVNGEWVELDECVGCQAEKDTQYIAKARVDIDQEFSSIGQPARQVSERNTPSSEPSNQGDQLSWQELLSEAFLIASTSPRV